MCPPCAHHVPTTCSTPMVPSGSQAGYVTTIEEYQHQRYEGGSTAYGPHTHGAMTNILREMAEEMAEGKVYRWPGAQPSIPTEHQMHEGQLLGVTMAWCPGRSPAQGPAGTDVVADDPPIGGSFGDVKQDVAPWYPPGATAQAGDLPVADDNDWELRFEWKRVGASTQSADRGWKMIRGLPQPISSGISASTVTITWEIPEDCPEGSYSLQLGLRLSGCWCWWW
eukprot:Skav208840  [mRNA]  locus=scaffold1193:186863:190979:+ [translate_table: standard]